MTKTTKRQVSLILMIALYVGAGVNHFINPQFYTPIIPRWIPEHKLVVAISGLCEIGLGLLLVFPSTRRFGAWCIIAFLVAVFPANIQALLNFIEQDHPRLWMAILRVPVQIVLILWAYSFAKPQKKTV